MSAAIPGTRPAAIRGWVSASVGRVGRDLIGALRATISVLSAAPAVGAFHGIYLERNGIAMDQSVDQVFGGVDTHKDAHVGAVVDRFGRLLGTKSFSTTTTGYEELLAWMNAMGSVAAIGVEGTGSYGAGLMRPLRSCGEVVKEVNRPNRQMRHRRGKNDAVDAEAAARAALSGQTAGEPKSQDGLVETIRLYRLLLVTFRKERTALVNTLRNVLITGPDDLRQRLEPLAWSALLKQCAQLRPLGQQGDPAHAARATLKALARQITALDLQLKATRQTLGELATAANPELMAAKGVGVDSATILLVAVGDNPERIRSESSLATFCGASPIEASSGKNCRHRLNRGGNRQANNALWRIAMIRLQTDPRTQEYARRRKAEGKTPRDITRCLKRFIAREIYRILTDPQPVAAIDDLRPMRLAQGLTMQAVTDHFNLALTTISRTERGIAVNHDFAREYRNWLEHQHVKIAA